MRPTGKVSIPNLLFFLGVGLVIYLAVVFVPPYLDHLDVVDAVRQGHSKAVSVQKASDEQVRNFVFDATERVGSHYELGEDGEEVEVKGLGLDDEAIEIERDDTGHVTVRVSYERKIQLFPLKTRRTLRLTATQSGTQESK